MPRQKAWLIVTLPAMPSAAVRSMIRLHREHAELARLVQVDVDGAAEALGKAEHRVEMALGVAVDRARVDAADDLGAQAQRIVHQLDACRAA